MRISTFEATKVHGYLPIRIDFHPDLTFITGLNGSGKTSALRLLMALLSPRIEDFASIDFETVSVTVSDESHKVVLRATRTPDLLEVSTSRLPNDSLRLTSAELQLLTEAKRRDESRSPLQEKIVQDPVFRSISQMSTPMFLGLDRRFFAPGLFWDDPEAQRRNVMMRQLWSEEPTLRGIGSGGLAEVNYLVVTTMQEIRAAQENLDARLRNQILSGAFKYEPASFVNQRIPSMSELEKYRKLQASVVRAAEQLKLPLADVKSALGDFFDKMTALVNALEKTTGTKKTSSRDSDIVPTPELFEWVVNRPQADRIFQHIRLLDTFATERANLHHPMDRFVSLVNGFLSQTKKQIQVVDRGDLAVVLDTDSVARPITALSSGERQIVVMLGHLSLNKSLAGSGVFIVDEPELSLHLEWQERFVSAVREANPSVQIILATHSPAIILDRHEKCRSLS